MKLALNYIKPIVFTFMFNNNVFVQCGASNTSKPSRYKKLVNSFPASKFKEHYWQCHDNWNTLHKGSQVNYLVEEEEKFKGFNNIEYSRYNTTSLNLTPTGRITYHQIKKPSYGWIEDYFEESNEISGYLTESNPQKHIYTLFSENSGNQRSWSNIDLVSARNTGKNKLIIKL